MAFVAVITIAAPPTFAAETLSLIIDARGEIAVPIQRTRDGVVLADLRRVAPDLGIVVEQSDDRVQIVDATGAEWRTGNGSLLLEGPSGRRILASAALITSVSIYLPLESIAELAGRSLVRDGNRARLTASLAHTATGDVHAPAGWKTVRIQKTAAEIADMQRLDGDPAGAEKNAVVDDVQPAAHDSIAVDIGVGYAQGMSGAGDVAASGTAAGFQVAFNAFMTYGRDGALYRSSRVSLRSPSATWWLEGGDLLSDSRGLARGVRVGRTVHARWQPSLAIYAPGAGAPARDRSALAYRDELRFASGAAVRAELSSDRSTFLGGRWLYRRTSVDTFYRYTADRAIRDRGVTASYDVWHGVTAQAGARLSTGRDRDRWYFAGVTLPVANLATVSLERTRAMGGATDAETSAFGLQLPLGRVRVMQRYQWTDIGFLRETAPTETGHRQLQSMASYSPTRRVQLTYQVATQWFSSVEARRWTELQTAVTLTRSTSLHAVTGLPDVGNIQRFRFGVQHTLPRGFRLALDYGALPAFQTSIADRAERARFLIMVRRTIAVSTPASGGDIEGRVLGGDTESVAGAIVRLGSYRTTSRADGGYRFARVPAGDYELALDTAHLPAQFTSDGAVQHVHASPGLRQTVDLHVVPLHAILGHVYLDRNDNGVFDAGEGIPNIVVRLSGDGAATLTGEDGAYGFYNLVPDRYRVRVDAERLRSDLTVISPGEIAVDLDQGGNARTGVDVQVAARSKPILIQKTRLP
jgi:hypothetical protein